MKNILFLICIFTFVPFVGYSFDEKQLLRFKVIKMCNNCDLSSSTLSKTDLNDSIISDTDFSNSKLDKVNFHKSKFKNTNFENSNLEAINFSKSDMNNLNFSDAKLKKANLEGINSNSLIFSNSTVSFANFSGSIFKNSEFINIIFFERNTPFWAHNRNRKFSIISR